VRSAASIRSVVENVVLYKSDFYPLNPIENQLNYLIRKRKMPNWCTNDVTFYHKDYNKVKDIFTAFYHKKELFAYFIPIPDMLNAEDLTKDQEEENKKTYWLSKLVCLLY